MDETRRLIQYKLDDSRTILVEVIEPVRGGLAPVGRASDTIVQAQQTLSEALENVRPAAEAIINKLTDLSQVPDEISVEFGLKLSAGAGAVIASVGVECNYIVRLGWKRSSSKTRS